MLSGAYESRWAPATHKLAEKRNHQPRPRACHAHAHAHSLTLKHDGRTQAPEGIRWPNKATLGDLQELGRVATLNCPNKRTNNNSPWAIRRQYGGGKRHWNLPDPIELFSFISASANQPERREDLI